MSHRTDPRRGRLPAVASLALIAVLIVSACGQSNPPASPSASPVPTSTAPTPAPSASASPASRERRPGRRRDLRRGRGAGRRDPRPQAEPPGRAPVHQRGRAARDDHRDVRRGHPARLPRRQRAAVQGARAHPGDERPARPVARPAERRRRRLLPERPGQALCRLQEWRTRPQRAVLLRPRVRPRPAGPELDDLQGPGRDPRPERPHARPRSRSTRATRRC